MKKIWIIIISIICLYFLFIVEESIRLEKVSAAKPLITFNQTNNCVTCMQPGEENDVQYYGLGYKVIIRYALTDDSTDADKKSYVIGKEFLLFNTFRLWAWII